LYFVGLTQVGFVYAIDFCKLDILFFKGCGGFFIMRRKGLAVATPNSPLALQSRRRNTDISYHGAKNSTNMRASGLTDDSKVDAVRLKTSDAASARARVTTEASERNDDARIVEDV
jgi:hypothetical protein